MCEPEWKKKVSGHKHRREKHLDQTKKIIRTKNLHLPLRASVTLSEWLQDQEKHIKYNLSSCYSYYFAGSFIYNDIKMY